MYSRSNRLAPSLVLLATLFAGALPSRSAEVVPKPAGPATVLVLAEPSAALGSALAQRPLTVRSGVAEAAGVAALRQDAGALAAIRGEGHHFVLLGGETAFGKTLLIEGETRVGDPSDFLHHGRLLLEEVRRGGARPILLVPPAKPTTATLDREAVAWAYHRLGREGGALLAPVDEAFERARRRRPDLALFDAYGDRWSPAGSYLAAAVVEVTITARMPGSIAPSGNEKAVENELPPDVRSLLNEVAWASVRDLTSSGGYRDIAAPGFPATPTLVRGEPVDLAKLRGRWRGPVRLYPWSANLLLDIREGNGGLSVRGQVHFDGGRPDLDFAAPDAELGSHVLSFRNPSDLANGRTVYRLSLVGERLRGVAELTTESGDLYAIGRFELRRVADKTAGDRR